jgi:hypothetical protein
MSSDAVAYVIYIEREIHFIINNQTRRKKIRKRIRKESEKKCGNFLLGEFISSYI